MRRKVDYGDAARTTLRAPGGEVDHPLNVVDASSAGTGASGRGGAGGGSQAKGGHALNDSAATRGDDVLKVASPVLGKPAPAKPGPGTNRIVTGKDLGHFLSRAGRNQRGGL